MFKKALKEIKKFGIIRILIIAALLAVAVYTQLPAQQITEEQSMEPISNDEQTAQLTGNDGIARQRFVYNKNATLKAVNVKFNLQDNTVNTDKVYIQVLNKDQFYSIKNGYTNHANEAYKENTTVLNVKDINPDGYTHIELKKPTFCMKRKSYYFFIYGEEIAVSMDAESRNQAAIGKIAPKLELGTAVKPNRVLYIGGSRMIRQGLMMTYECEYDNSNNMLIVYAMVIFLAIAVVPPRWFYKGLGDAFGWSYFILNPTIVLLLNFKLAEAIFKYQYVYFFTWLLLLGIQMIIYAIIGNKNAAMIITTIAAFILNIVNTQVAVFKGEPIAPQDVLFLETAADVSSQYTITWSTIQQRNLTVMAVYVVFMFIVFTQNHKERDERKRLKKLAKNAAKEAESIISDDKDAESTDEAKDAVKAAALANDDITPEVKEIVEESETDESSEEPEVKKAETDDKQSEDEEETDNRTLLKKLYDHVDEKSETVHTYRKYKKLPFTLRRVIERGTIGVLGFVILFMLYATSILADHGIQVFPFNRNSSTIRNGIVLEFFMDFHYLGIDKPKDYSLKNLKAVIEKDTTSPESPDVNPMTGGEDPNILVVMNESLADYTTINDGRNVWFDEDYMPNMHAMNSNVVKGKCYVSTYGGQTANAEFEQITANSLAFFPTGSVAFQQFMSIDRTTFGLPLYLQTKGYRTMAIHPAVATNWNREEAYPSLNFQKFLTLKDFKDPEIIRYVSDRETYKKVIEQFENKDKDEKLYIHCVTIQNHGGYTNATDWEHPLLAMKGGYSKANEYISSVYVADQAYKGLIDYFKDYDEPTIILMFGDHQPALGGFENKALGTKSLPAGQEPPLEMMQEKYCTNYILWANYDIKDNKLNETSSLNFLSNLLLDKAGVPLSRYQQIVSEVNDKVQAMNAFGYMLKSDGKWHEYSEKTEASDVLDKYHMVEYGYFSEKDQESISKLFELPLKDDNADTGE